MRAIVRNTYGSPDVLEFGETDKPELTDDGVLVRVRAASINAADWYELTGTPYVARMQMGLRRPKSNTLGVDFAGTVEAVGRAVTQLRPGDDVFGGRSGAFADYVCARRAVVAKPAALTFEEAAAVPVAALTALEGLRDTGKLQPGQKVLINGASGGVGTFAVQLAKTFGAEVAGVCSGRNAELVRSLGADHVIDYTKEDFTKRAERYDLILDNVGNRSPLECRRALNPNGKIVVVGGGGVNDSRWTGPLVGVMKMLVLKRFVTQEMTMMLAEMNGKDLTLLEDLIQTGKVKVVIDRTYTFSQLPEAMRYLEEGHARGKVVVTVGNTIEPLAPSPNRAAGSDNRPSPVLIAIELIGIPLGVLVLPIVFAFALNRRFKRRNPEKRGYRWGYYFSIMSIVAGLILGFFLECGVTGVIVCALIYALLAWFFAQRHHWAWIALTILSFNPIAWIINAIYLRKRWAEEPSAAATV